MNASNYVSFVCSLSNAGQRNRNPERRKNRKDKSHNYKTGGQKAEDLDAK